MSFHSAHLQPHIFYVVNIMCKISFFEFLDLLQKTNKHVLSNS